MLTTGFWPTYKNDDLNLPSEMLACIETFKAFYDKRTSHRRLRWVHQLGNAQVLGNFLPNGKKKQHDLVVSTYQACILLLFNNQVRRATLAAVRRLPPRARPRPPPDESFPGRSASTGCMGESSGSIAQTGDA